MAIVKDIHVVNGKENHSKEITHMEVGVDRQTFSIRTYRAIDVDRRMGASQNIQLYLDEAIILRNALNDFIGEKKERSQG